MTVAELGESLKHVPQDLEVRVEVDNYENYWVRGLEVHETGSSGYEIEGEVVLEIGG